MKQRISFLLACVFLCLTGCRASGAEQTFFAMDTVMSVQVSGRRGPQAVAAAREAVERLDGLLSRTDSDSQIARLNTAAGDGAAVAVDPWRNCWPFPTKSPGSSQATLTSPSPR